MLRLIIVVAAMLLVARLVGTTRPTPAVAAVVSNPDGSPCEQPCMFGIRPGETRREQGIRLLQSHPLTRSALWIGDSTLKLAGPDTYVVFHTRPDDVVESVGLTASIDRPDSVKAPAAGSLMESIVLGEYMLAFGISDIHFIHRNSLVFLDPETGATAYAVRPDDRSQLIEPDIPLSALVISTVVPCGQMEYGAGGAWKGFTAVEQYLNDWTFVPLVPSRFDMPAYRVCQK